MTSVLGNVARATAILVALNLVAKLLGFVREMVIAYFFGAGAALDAYLVAYSIPTIIFALIAGALTTVVIPIYSDYVTREGEDSAWRLFANVFNILLILLLILTALGVALSPVLVKLLAPFFPEATRDLAIQLTRIVFPILIFSGIAALFNGLLNARNIFGVTALNSSLLNLGVIGAVVLVGSFWGVYGMAVGLVVGGVLGTLVQIPSLIKGGFRLRWTFDVKHPGLKQMLILILPVAVGLSIGQTYVIVDRILASGLQEGSLSALNYANRLIQLPLGLFVTPIGTAFYPTFTQLAAEKRFTDLKAGITRALRAVLAVCIPAAIGLMVLRDPIITLAFKRGQFDETAAALTSVAMFFYALGLIGLAAEFVLARGFYALHDTRTPVKVGFLAVGVNLAVSLILVRYLDLGGLALGSSIAALTAMLVLIHALGRRLEGFWDRAMWRFIGVVILATSCMGGAVYGIYHYGGGFPLFQGGSLALLLHLGFAVLAGIGIYVGVLSLFRLDEAKSFWSLLVKILGRVQGKK